MKLIKLSIRNFKCLPEFELDAQGANVSIYAENGIGKTTIADAYYWLLFGKNSQGQKDFEIKPIGEDGEPVHFLESSVLGIFEMPDGTNLTLERVYKEIWETKRGSATKTFSGHTTDFFANGVPMQAGEYQKRIASICDEDAFRLLTDPARFLALPWQDRRKMLFDVCGDMSDEQVLEACKAIEEFKDVPELGTLTEGKTIADFKKVVEATKKKVNEERASVPARIDEATRAIPAEDNTGWQSELAKRNAELSALQDERSKLQAGGKSAEIKARIAEIGAEITTVEASIRNAPNPEREKEEADKLAKSAAIRQAESEAADLASKLASSARTLQSMDAELETKRKAAASEQATVFATATECPTCLQPIPEEKIEQARSEFNANKASMLDAMIQAGKKLRADRDELDSKIQGLEKALKESQAAIGAMKAERDAIVIPEQAQADPSKDPKHIELTAKKAEAQEELSKLNESMQAALDEINAQIVYAEASVRQAQSHIAMQNQREQGLARVEELKAKEKELGAEYERLERSLYLCEQFVRAKVRLLTDQINARFTKATFRLFKEQINGGIAECCDVLWRENEALPSNGQAVQIGLDIIATLSAHREFAPCIFIDNAESVTDLPATQGQQIALVVSKGDKDLRIVRGEVPAQTETREPQTALF